ncbi:hypothetical protein [Streptomyces griseorubiginosus]|uniref:hypothetical protein n=1 Tax=Streptomyces griseorubiginosus TaxID=67304 RepID=UPI0011404357|nr:hypothetical protein [Streptomyces griseorubiginosus]
MPPPESGAVTAPPFRRRPVLLAAGTAGLVSAVATASVLTVRRRRTRWRGPPRGASDRSAPHPVLGAG